MELCRLLSFGTSGGVIDNHIQYTQSYRQPADDQKGRMHVAAVVTLPANCGCTDT